MSKKVKETNLKVSGKKELLGLFQNANVRLDILRNGIFNIMVSMRYVKENEFNVADTDFDNFNNAIKYVENKFNEIVKKLDLKLGDVIKNE